MPEAFFLHDKLISRLVQALPHMKSLRCIVDS